MHYKIDGMHMHDLETNFQPINRIIITMDITVVLAIATLRSWFALAHMHAGYSVWSVPTGWPIRCVDTGKLSSS